MQRNHNHHQGTNKVSPATVYGTAFIWLNPPCMLVECQNFLVMISYMQLFLLFFSRAICVMHQVGDILPQIQQLQEGLDTWYLEQYQKYVYAATPRPRERFENANICISPTSQETVGSHLKPSLPVVVMATLNQFNSNLSCGFSS